MVTFGWAYVTQVKYRLHVAISHTFIPLEKILSLLSDQYTSNFVELNAILVFLTSSYSLYNINIHM